MTWIRVGALTAPGGKVTVRPADGMRMMPPDGGMVAVTDAVLPLAFRRSATTDWPWLFACRAVPPGTTGRVEGSVTEPSPEQAQSVRATSIAAGIQRVVRNIIVLRAGR